MTLQSAKFVCTKNSSSACECLGQTSQEGHENKERIATMANGHNMSYQLQKYKKLRSQQ